MLAVSCGRFGYTTFDPVVKGSPPEEAGTGGALPADAETEQASSGAGLDAAGGDPRVLDGRAPRDAGGGLDQAAPDADAATSDADADTGPTSPPDWLLPAWGSRIKITLAGAPAGADLDGFPILVTLTPSNYDYARGAADGRDLRFFGDAGQPLPYEIEQFTPAGTSQIWVRVPLVSDAGVVAKGIEVYFENAAATAAEDPAAVFGAGFSGVFHLNQSLVDSSGNGNDGTNAGSTDDVGVVAGGRHFTYASAESVTIGSNQFPTGTTDRTLCAWANTDAVDSPIKHWFVSYGAFANDGGFFIGRVGADFWCGGVGADVIATGTFTIGAWSYLCCVVSAGQVTLYANGQPLGAPVARSWSVAPGAAHIGGHINPANIEWWDGKVDEVRVSRVARSGAWIEAEYQSMTGTLLTYGPVEHLQP